MGTVKNVEMNYFNGVDYDIIRPEIGLENVNDWTNSLYNKTEVDELVNNLNSQYGNLFMSLGNYMGQYNLLPYSGESSSGRTANWSDWSIIQVGFQPTIVIFFWSGTGFCYENTSGSVSDSTLAWVGSMTESSLGVDGVSAAEPLENGFRVRNVIVSGRYSIRLDLLTCKYWYLAIK